MRGQYFTNDPGELNQIASPSILLSGTAHGNWGKTLHGKKRK